MRGVRGVGRRGLSPVVATVLLIVLVIVLATMIFLWARGFIDEKTEKFGKPIDSVCSSVYFVVDLVDNDDGYNTLEVLNRGNVGIASLEIKKYAGGNSESSNYDVNLFPGDSSSVEASLDVMGDGVITERIEIFPVLSGIVEGESERELFVCYDYGVELEF